MPPGGPKTHENLQRSLEKSITMDNQVCYHSQIQTADIFKYIYTPTYTCMDTFYIYIHTYKPCNIKVYQLVPKHLILTMLCFND